VRLDVVRVVILIQIEGARRLARNDVAALVLTALFALSPQIIDIDLVRIDRFMLLPLVVILHESLRITQGDPPHGAALGAAAGGSLIGVVGMSQLPWVAVPFIALALLSLWPDWRDEQRARAAKREALP
jgi:hypothetical protein